MVLLNDTVRGEISSFVIQLHFLYINKDFLAFEKQIVCKILELLKDVDHESLKKLYWYVDPIYQLLYYEIKMKTVPISRTIQKVIELASLPLYQMPEEIRENHLLKLNKLLSAHKA